MSKSSLFAGKFVHGLLVAMALTLVPSDGSWGAADQKPKADGEVVVVETSMGTFKIRLFPDKAPATVANFLAYVDKKFYDGTLFHRVVPKLAIQGGGFTKDLKEKATRPAIKSESDNGLSNTRGSVGMARMKGADTATAQFFVNLGDNSKFFDRTTAQDKVGYTVFGEVIEGMEVVDKIGSVKTEKKKVLDYVPVKPVVIVSIRREKGVDDRRVVLFNGKDLTGWEPDRIEKTTYRVEKTELVIESKAVEQQGWLVTKQDYADFLLRFEFKIVGEVDGGVVFRHTPGAKPLKVILIDNEKRPAPLARLDHRTGGLWWPAGDAGGRRVADRRVKLKALDWNVMEIEVKGRNLRVTVNGEEVLEESLDKLEDSAKELLAVKNASGKIGFQSLGGVIRFRNVEIIDLSKK